MTCVSLDCMRGRRRWLAWPTTRVCYILLKTITKYQGDAVIFFWGLRLSPIDPQSASLKKVKPRWGTLFHCPEKTSDSSTLHLLRCFLPRGAGCEPENLLLELRLPHFNLWIFFKSSSPHTDSIWGHVFHVVSVLDVLTVFRTSEFEVDNGGEWASTARGLLLWSASSGATTSSREPPVPW
jgi:hypothetical protein